MAGIGELIGELLYMIVEFLTGLAQPHRPAIAHRRHGTLAGRVQIGLGGARSLGRRRAGYRVRVRVRVGVRVTR